MELLGSNAPRLIHLLARPSVSRVYLKAVNLYIKLKGAFLNTHSQNMGFAKQYKMHTFQVYI